MKEDSAHIEEWISQYATIIGNANVIADQSLRNIDPLKFYLHITIPKNFEAYAICLSSFWINYKISDENIHPIENDDEDFPEEDYTRISWKEFYRKKDRNFNLIDAVTNKDKIHEWHVQLNNELYPGEGQCDIEHLKSLQKNVVDIYGDEEIKIFYTFLSTNDWQGGDRFFKGKISELDKLFDNKMLNYTPSLIYPKSRKWVLNSDYDLPFTFIGGEKKLIQKLVSQNEDEIFQIEY